MALAIVYWTLNDGEQRARAGCAVALLVGMTWHVGLLIGLLF